MRRPETYASPPGTSETRPDDQESPKHQLRARVQFASLEGAVEDRHRQSVFGRPWKTAGEQWIVAPELPPKPARCPGTSRAPPRAQPDVMRTGTVLLAKTPPQPRRRAPGVWATCPRSLDPRPGNPCRPRPGRKNGRGRKRPGAMITGAVVTPRRCMPIEMSGIAPEQNPPTPAAEGPSTEPRPGHLAGGKQTWYLSTGPCP